MRPTRNLLLAVGVHPLAVADVSDVAHHDTGRAFGYGVLYNGSRDLMLNVAPLTVVSGQQLSLPPLETFPEPRPLLALALPLLETGKPLVAVLVQRSQLSPCEDDDFALFVGNGHRVYLAQVHRQCLVACVSLGNAPSSITKCQLYRLLAWSYTSRASRKADLGRLVNRSGRVTITGSSPLARANSSRPSFTRMPVSFQVVVLYHLRLCGYFAPRRRLLLAVLHALWNACCAASRL